MATVGQILADKGRDVVTLGLDVTLRTVIDTLASHKIGAIVLTRDNGSVAGIVSERDVVRVLAASGVEAMSYGVREAMTMTVKTCAESMTIDEALEIMTKGRFRHLPVCHDNKLIGIVSIGDIVKRKIENAEREAQQMREYIAAG